MRLNYSAFQILDDKDIENLHLKPMPTGNILIIKMPKD